MVLAPNDVPINGGARTVIGTVTVCWSTVTATEPLPPLAPALNVAVAAAWLLSVSGCACGTLPSTAEPKVTGRPASTVTSASVLPLLSFIAPVTVLEVLILILFGEAEPVSCTQGLMTDLPPLVVGKIVSHPAPLGGVLQPHQLSVALTKVAAGRVLTS